MGSFEFKNRFRASKDIGGLAINNGIKSGAQCEKRREILEKYWIALEKYWKNTDRGMCRNQIGRGASRLL